MAKTAAADTAGFVGNYWQNLFEHNQGAYFTRLFYLAKLGGGILICGARRLRRFNVALQTDIKRAEARAPKAN
jgi:hypothetical protein